ncbi:alpha/beta hydrolase family protein [Tessaracoccus rhinocerotis]|uniref:alpha/beta hydrolase family protein n=1 Tax=Tessaracoccus rhinocerotis TaxID=1689449 RepID=UPI00163DDE97|nr:alpha/beta fold hydrolase [Tessaracoccus rhinocerotis]
MNYQLNRWYSLGYSRLQDLETAGREIRRVADNKPVFTKLAEAAVREGRWRNAAFAFRAAEFLTDPADPDKSVLYGRFVEAFDRGFADEGFERGLVPYGAGHLPTLRLRAVGHRRGTVVAHGGFDSFMEEFFCFWRVLADRGYDVVAFEGPGQGAAHRVHGLAHDHDWEKPTGAVLDHYGLEDVALLGISFGGYWCVRAAAFDKRITRLIVDPPLYDLVAAAGPVLRRILREMLARPALLNWSIRLRMRAFPVLRHTVRQALFMTNQLDAEPSAAVQWLLGMNERHLSSELVDQDVLLMGGEKDRFQPLKLFHLQRVAMVNAKSLSGRIFSSAEHAENHCQMGNLRLALRVMADWLDGAPGASS